MKFRKIFLVDIVLIVATLLLVAFTINSTTSKVQLSPGDSQDYLFAFSSLDISYTNDLSFEEYSKVEVGTPFVLNKGTYYFENGGELISFEIEVEKVSFVVIEKDGRYLLVLADSQNLNVEENYLGEYQRDFYLSGGRNE